jgi:membrane glycosyltransferase
VIAVGWLAGLASLSWSLVWWLLPVVAALFLSIPVSVYSSRVSLGRTLRRWRLFMTPEETAPPEVIERLHAAMERRHGSRPRAAGPRQIAIAAAQPRNMDDESARALQG